MKYGVILVDCINGFFKEGTLANPANMKMVPQIVELCKNATDVVAVCDSHMEDDEEFKVWPKHCIKDTAESEVIDELKPYVKCRFDKTRYSGFYGTLLDEYIFPLDETDGSTCSDWIQDWVIVGVCSDMCVMCTTADARNRDLNVHIIKECVDTFTIPGHDKNEINKVMFESIYPIVFGCKMYDTADKFLN